MKPAIQAQHHYLSSSQADYITVHRGLEGAVSLPVHPGVPVEFFVAYAGQHQRYAIFVWVGNDIVGCHCGDRTRRLLLFSRKSDADRVADARNAFWEARRNVCIGATDNSDLNNKEEVA